MHVATTGTRIALLDGFAVHAEGEAASRADDLPHGVQRLVAHLGLSGRPARPAVAGQLWPDLSEEQAHGCLRTVLWRVQKALPGLLSVAAGTLSLADDVRVDVRELSAWARQVLDPGSDLAMIAPADVDLRGELLPGWYDDWVLLERERLRQLRMHALEALADRLAAAGRYGEAVQAAYAAVRAEPLRESAHRAVVRVHLAEGNLVEAVRVYEVFREMLAEELGVTPSPQMTTLIPPARRPRRCGRRADDGAPRAPLTPSASVRPGR